MKKLSKSTLLDRLRIIRKELPQVRDYIENEYIDSEGFAVIAIHPKNRESIFHPFSASDKVSPELYGYIESLTYPINSYIPLKIIFEEDFLSPNEQQELVRIILNHYKLKLYEKDVELKLNLLRTFSLLAIGAFLYSMSFWLSTIKTGPFLHEIVSIGATFAVWESVSHWIIERKNLRLQWMNAGQLATMNIDFKRQKN